MSAFEAGREDWDEPLWTPRKVAHDALGLVLVIGNSIVWPLLAWLVFAP